MHDEVGKNMIVSVHEGSLMKEHCGGLMPHIALEAAGGRAMTYE